MYNFYDEMDYLEKVAAEAGDPTEMYNRYARNSGQLLAGGLGIGLIPHAGAGIAFTGMGLAGAYQAYKADKLKDQANIDHNDPRQYHRAKRVSSQWKAPAAGFAAMPAAAVAGALAGAGKTNAALIPGAVALGAGLYGMGNLLKTYYHGAREAIGK